MTNTSGPHIAEIDEQENGHDEPDQDDDDDDDQQDDDDENHTNNPNQIGMNMQHQL